MELSTDLWDTLWGWLRAEYEEHLNPKMWRAHLYVGIGLTMQIILLLLPFSISGVTEGMGLAAGIFAFHEYVGQRCRDFMDFLHIRYGIEGTRVLSSSFFVAGVVVFLDLLIAVPMFGYSEYSFAVFLFVTVLAMYWIMAQSSFLMVKSIYTRLAGLSRNQITLVAMFLFSMTVYALVNLSEFIWVLDSMVPLSFATGDPPSESVSFISILAAYTTLIVLYVLVTVALAVMAVLGFFLLVISIPFFLLYAPELWVTSLGDMSFTLRLWAVISILVIYFIVSAPTLLSSLDSIRSPTELRTEG